MLQVAYIGFRNVMIDLQLSSMQHAIYQVSTLHVSRYFVLPNNWLVNSSVDRSKPDDMNKVLKRLMILVKMSPIQKTHSRPFSPRSDQ